MLTKYKDHCTRWVERPVSILAHMGCTPNGLTLFSLVLGVLTSIWFVWHRNPLLFGTLLIIWGLFDLLDGTLARLTDQRTRFGAYLDAICDRLFETTAVIATAYVSGYWFCVLVGWQVL